MPSSAPRRIAIIGAGPRGTSVLERLISQLQDRSEPLAGSLQIDLVDPFDPGPGRVWRTSQSELYLMNTQSFYPTVVPDQGVDSPPVSGLSFDQWRARFAPQLASTEFPPRALYGQYLRWTFEELLRRLPHEVTVHWHRTEALAISRTTTAAGGFAVRLGSGDELLVEAVVLALGHLQAELSSEQREFAEAASRWNLGYWPPAIPADVDWREIPAGQNVLVRGMGLNFFDLIGQWTEGRGGVFEATGEGAGRALKYLPSGEEPVILAASRRGSPYRAKADLDSYYPRGVELRFLNQLLAEREAPGPNEQIPGFDHDIWPALHRDVTWSYYRTLLRGTPSEGLLGDLAAILDGPGWSEGLKAFEARLPAADRLDIEALAKPFAGQHFAGTAEFDRAVLLELERDAQGSAAAESDPVKMAIGTLNEGRALIKQLVADGGITEESWLGELRGWFEPLVEGLASGPPSLRIEQLAALVRAGIVGFTGPDPVFAAGPDGFTASSPWLDAAPRHARYLVEALAPSNRVLQSSSPLMRQLLADGLVRPKAMLAADGEVVLSSGLEVTTPPYRAIDGSGSVLEGLYVLGLQLSSVQWGTAIAAEAHAKHPSGYRSLIDADSIASHLLESLQL